jgi:hypothetical protein
MNIAIFVPERLFEQLSEHRLEQEIPAQRTKGQFLRERPLTWIINCLELAGQQTAKRLTAVGDTLH